MRAYHISVDLVAHQEGLMRLDVWKLSEDKFHNFGVRLSDSNISRYDESVKDFCNFLACQVFDYLDSLQRSV